MAYPALAQQADAPVSIPTVKVQGATLEPPRKATSPGNTEQTSAVPAKPTQKAGPAQASGPSSGSESAESNGEAGNASGGVPADHIGSAVTVVTGQQLRDQQVRTAADALRSLPGVEVSRTNGFTGLTQVRIRGANSDHTLVLIDGIEANSPASGDFDFSDLSADNIDRIEVIRGGQSALYGSSAVGGVINIITKSGRGPITVTATGEIGSFGTRRGNVTISGGTDKAWGAVSFEKAKSDGFPISPYDGKDDPGDLKTFNFKGGVRLAPGLTLDGVVRSTNKNGYHDTEDAVLGQLQQQIYDGSNFSRKALMEAANLRLDTMGGDLTQILKFSHSDADTKDYSPTFLFETKYGEERTNYGYTISYRFNTPGIPGLRQSVTGLYEHGKESFTPQSFSTDPFFPSSEDGIARNRSRDSVAGEWSGDFGNRLFLTAGLRQDWNDVFEDFTTWRTTASLKLPEVGLRPHASVGTSVKFPTMYEQFGSLPHFFTPNPNLKPEESLGWDMGLEFNRLAPGVLVDVTYFNATLKNEINGTAIDPATFNFTPVNLAGTSHRQGIELSGSYDITRNLRLSAAYTWLDAEKPDGTREVRRPDHTARADLTYKFLEDRARFTVSAVYNGEMDDAVRRVTGFSFGFPVLSPEVTTLDSYWLVNAAASYRINKNMEIFGRVENLLNEKYQEVYGFATPGIAFYGGMKITYEDPNTASWAKYRD